MRFKGRSTKGLLVALILTLIPITAFSAQKITPGSTCKVYKQKVTNQNKVYTCIKSGKKLVWNKGVAVVKPTPTPSPTVSPTASPTSSPTASPTASPIPTPTASPTPTFSLTDLSTLQSSSNCKLKDFSLPNIYSAISAGFPNPSALSGKKIIRTIALHVDYPDLQGNYDPSAEKIDAIEEINDFYKSASYGKLKFEWTVPNFFSRMPHEVGYYNLTRATFQTINPYDNINFLQDAINVSDPRVDFSKFDLVIIFGPKQATTSQIGEYPGTRSGTNYKVMSNEGQVRNIQTSIAKGFKYGYTKLGNYYSAGLIHEIGHELGLVDLYLYPNNEPNLYGTNNRYSTLGTFGPFDYMNNMGGPLPEPNGWNRWLLGFIDDGQIACLKPTDSGTFKVENLGKAGVGLKLMVIKVSESEAILIESRRSEGYDYSLSLIDEGLLIYRVDTKWTTGHGAFGLVLKKGITKPDLGDALVRLGESVTISGITITNMSKSDTFDIVTVTQIP